ncbi:dynein axonemal heavy chain 2 isoform X5 [Cavia porcellus]|uniref:dynein axonemal heavy chain 2 isoform X5 n=1 Tax=Cavia porcellus TaxID=10141 RepID=UPI002FDF252F
MSNKAEKKRKVTRPGSRAPKQVRAVQSALDPQATESTVSAPEPESEPELPKEKTELIVEEPEVLEEEVEEPEVDVKSLFLARAVLTGLADAVWTEEHDAVLSRFVQDPLESILTIFIDPCFGLKLELGMPIQTQNQLVYFIRQAPVTITAENFEATVQFGTVRGAYIPALLRLLSGVYAPQIFTNTTWPESIRNHFTSQLHKFLACLTDTRYKLEGHTVLYIPAETENMRPEVVVKDKELVQRLETSMIHWTRQIKEVLSAQETVETGENSGPLEEIEFWLNRCTDLSGISKQLVKKGVKHIETILRLSKSSYLMPFMKLAQQIQDGSAQAQSNLTFLSILKEPYQELAHMHPKDIANKLPRLISLIRIIWVNSPYYNTRERLTSLFRKMSNEIIRLCCHAISLDRIFEGYVSSSKVDLQGCITCCHAWKDHYLQAVQMHTQFSGRGWVLDQTSIFAQVDAFVQRCKDLIEVCDCQYHFARWEDGKQGPLPCFFGAQGPQITRNLLEIEDIFHKNLHVLRAVRGGILDVKNTSWHEDYNKFRTGIKDLEVMTQNLITSAFELVRDVEHGVLLLDTFHRLASRETIKRTYDKKAVDLYMLFNNELALVNRELNKKWSYLEPYMAQYSGQAHRMRVLRRRIDRVMNCLSGAHFLPHIGTGEETVHTYQQMAQAIDEMVRKTFQEWTSTLDKDCIRRLDIPLLRISQEKAGMLDVNFDKFLLILFTEIDYWERLLFEIPHYVVNLAERAEDLRVLRENLLLVARDYNRIIAMLSPDEQALFKERIRFLDKKIHPGLKNLNWALKGASAFFITECRIHASKVQMIVNDFKASTLTIGWRAQEISETLLVRISGKRVYRDLEFEEDQREHREAVQQKLMKLHQDVVNIMTNSYEVFKNDGAEIQQQWMLYTIRLDHMMEDALRLNVKWSLLELSKAINGDGKTTPNPLFRVLVILKTDVQGGEAQVEFSPTLQTLAGVVNDIGSHLISTISVFRHLPDILIKRKMQRDPIHTIVERDEDIKKIQVQISTGMTNNASLLQNYLKTWDMYREIWEINKDSFIRRYQRLNPPVSSFDADIARHWDQVRDEIHRVFDQESESFTLEQIVELGMDQHVEKIGEISASATKELAIELALQNIAKTWDVTQLDIVPYKDKGHHRLRGTEEIFQVLEDNQVALSTMKASRFVKAFEKDVDHWERCLSLILEVIETVLTVQRQWMYLENIFLGEDIRKQLPSESALFDQVNNNWKSIMDRMSKDSNALRSTHYPGLLDNLIEMNTILEDIQKSLDMYLETKRHIFPRFYFLSNDDLLEILGQSRNPEAVQPHLKKCFDNIKLLKMQKMGGAGSKWEAAGMFSGDGEYVDFLHPVLLEGPVEVWLGDVERAMKLTLRDLLRNCRLALKKFLNKRDKWVKEWAGQMVITTSQIQWTADVTKCLLTAKERADKKILKVMKKKQVSILNKYSEAIRGNLTKIMRLKIVALVTIEIHARDVLEKLYKSSLMDVNSFDWLSQLRFYWEKDLDDCVIRQTNTQFQYGYEYLGNSGRLVITPLTDRCYMTLTTALHLHRGGSPKGPAGTGKTETVKDLGKALGLYVIVVNCSEGLDYKSMGRMYSGLAQSGAWGCFDEFNRINIEVLSVVAQQILSILSALAAGLTRFHFEGFEINLVWSCGIFITMNPGYAGRTELPENLKSMFRPIAMVVPDSILIAEIILFGEGFGNCKILAKKVYTLYSLAVQQLSKQDHYDFGLRALTSLVRYAGKKRRLQPDLSDEEVLLLSMRDMNIAKLTSVDVPLFNAIVQDLFPSIELPVVDYGKLQETIEQEVRERGLQCTPFTLTKVLQLYETKNSRHSTMIVGNTGSGKTTCWRVLQASLSSLCRAGDPNFNIVREFPLNPKALSLGELYGEYDLNTNEWTDGILSSVMRVACADEKPDEKWILFDGPVDTLWIESMNSVMDDNKVLTLINGERISMPEQVSLLFEVENLAMASPATVSRCGMVYTDYVDLGWRPYVQSWLEKRPKSEVEPLQRMFDKLISKILTFKKDNCTELVPVPEYSCIISLCKLYSALATPENGVNPADSESYSATVEMIFVFSMIWSVCASVDEDGRKKIDSYLREIEGSFPNKDTVYEYFVDPKMRSWTSFEETLPKSWRYTPNTPFYKIMVPTVDTVRYKYLVNTLVDSHNPVLLVGPVGTGKTSIAQSVLQSLPSSQWSVLTVNMSAQTTSNNVQSIIESRVEKRTKSVYVPFGGKSMITFMDELNMPAKDTFGSQPPLELIRLWIDYGFWYDRAKQTIKYIRDMFLMAAMGPPGGGRTVISPRLQSRFNLINMTFPTESQIIRIFGTMINQKLQDFDEEVKPIGNVVTEATLDVYNTVVQRFLPTPAKIHYLFNLRDISKVFQGMLRANKDFHDTKASITRLWIHECFRVFSDRLVDATDMEAFVGIISDKLGSFFDLTFHNLCPNRRPPIFGDFLKEPKVYEDLTDLTVLKTAIENALNEYNLSPSVVPMKLVLFREAIEHITRIVRVIGQPRGNMLLVGIGGSGRQSLARLASSICEYDTFQIEVTKHYRKQEFRDDIKRLYRQAGVELKTTSFLFVDTQIADESFLEDINNILSSGEVPNLYKADEFEEIQTLIIDQARAEQVPETSDSLFTYLIERVRNNLHIVLCLSPVGDPFRNWIRQYPALVNCTTINWFSEWPREALLEVAEKYLVGVDLGPQENIHKKVAQIFVTMHWSVAQYSQKMLLELRRHNYVTPTNYLELVSGYKKLLGEKRQELLDQANKLRTGLFKIDETREKVEVMSLELEEAKKKVAEFQKQCEEYLVIIVQQKREADEQQKAVTANSEKIAVEEVKCQALADNAQKDLEEALPALEEAMRALESLNKKDIGEIKSYGRPPAQVEMVMQAVMILRGNEPTWTEAKRQLGEQNFIKSLIHFDKDNISDKVLKKIGAYCAQPDFQPDIIGRVSLAAKSLCMWVRAMELYGRLYRVVEPKRIRMNAALAQLQEKQAALAEAQEKLREVAEKLEMLKRQYDEKLAQKEELRKKSEEMQLKLERAGILVSGLAGEKARWEETVQGLEEDLGYLVGDCLLAAAFLSYMGPFLTNYRDEIVNHIWIRKIRELQVPCSPRFAIDNFLSNPTKVRDWNIQGLPSDAFSTENGIIVTRGNRWALMIDPQAQAQKWIKNMEGNQGLKIIDLQMNNYLRILEQAIQFGHPVLLQNVQEYLDPTLNPVLNKSVAHVGGQLLMRIGDKEVAYNPSFRFYITTKLSNPHYSPETSAKTTIVNFAVKEQGLEAQLLGIVVRKERPELEEQKDSLVINIAAGKRKLKELEDEILRLLNEATGSLLDDVQLVNTLQTSKVTASEVTEQLETSETTEVNIDLAREAYRPCAQRASVLFFVLNDMGCIDPMYQFSLDAYISLFILSIDKSHRSNKLEDRIEYLNDYHTYAVYRYTCRTLFERHKLLFSFHMCAKILETSGKLNVDEYNFFLRGGVVLDREGQMDNPCPGWLADAYWDNIMELDKLTNFHGLMNSFEQYPRDWHLWYTNATPEKAMLPGEWDNACNEMQRMLIVRSLRQDRVAFCVTSFVISNLGSRFVEPPVLNMKLVMEDSTPRTPLVFILSPGVDPTGALLQLAEHTGMAQRFHALSLGQGQAPIAARLLRDGVSNGHWVFLANCHLSLSWMPNLDKLVEQLQVEDPHPSFRLWLSSSPHPDFPISILQASIKMTTEPPKGLKANMTRIYQLMSEPQFTRCSKPAKYKKLLFALCFFHSVLLERKKFLQLGWNIIYGFNDSDFEVSENLLSLYLDEYEETAWDALKYLIAGINYGGHVTDDWDRRLLTTYINDYFCDQALSTPFYRLSALETYFIPKDGSLASYKEYISLLPSMDPPEAFGQHPNADVASQITEARTLFETLLSLQPQITPTSAGGQSREEKVLELAADVKQKIPEMIDYEGTRKVLAPDPSPLNVVLLQEIQRYNKLMETILSSLTDLEKGIQGLIVMSTSLEEIFNCIFDAHVPPLWGKAYPSQKPLASWTRDLALRVEQFELWASRARPPVIFWLSGFTFPTGFLTAVLQSSARQNNISVDSLSWEFIVSTVDDSNLVYPPKDGVWVRGLYLEGAGWDRKNSCLVEAEPMQLVCLMPTIHFRPAESRKKSAKGMYSCPCYYYPNRAGSTDRTSFVIGIDLRSGAMTSDHWIKRGTALLMSLDS